MEKRTRKLEKRRRKKREEQAKRQKYLSSYPVRFQLDTSRTDDPQFRRVVEKVLDAQWKEILAELSLTDRKILFGYTQKNIPRAREVFGSVFGRDPSEEAFSDALADVKFKLIDTIRARLGSFNSSAYAIQLGKYGLGYLPIRASSLERRRTSGGIVFKAPVPPMLDGRLYQEPLYYHSHVITRIDQRFPAAGKENLFFNAMIWQTYAPDKFQVFCLPIFKGHLSEVLVQKRYWISFGAFAFRKLDDMLLVVTYMPPGFKGTPEDQNPEKETGYLMTRRSFLKVEKKTPEGWGGRHLTDEEFEEVVTLLREKTPDLELVRGGIPASFNLPESRAR